MYLRRYSSAHILPSLCYKRVAKLCEALVTVALCFCNLFCRWSKRWTKFQCSAKNNVIWVWTAQWHSSTKASDWFYTLALSPPVRLCEQQRDARTAAESQSTDEVSFYGFVLKLNKAVDQGTVRLGMMLSLITLSVYEVVAIERFQLELTTKAK